MRRPDRHRRGFSLVEAAAASIVLGLLAAATMNAVGATVKARAIEADRSRARDLAADLIAEIQLQQYTEPGVTTSVLGPEAGETARANFDDVDDYDGLKEAPPCLADGTVIAGLTGWSRSAVVAWVTTADPTVTSATETGLKRITVTVGKGGKTLATAVALRSAAWDKACRTGVTISAPWSMTGVGGG